MYAKYGDNANNEYLEKTTCLRLFSAVRTGPAEQGGGGLGGLKPPNILTKIIFLRSTLPVNSHAFGVRLTHFYPFSRSHA